MNTELLRLLVSKGLSAEDILEISEVIDKPKERTANAARQARFRARRKAVDSDESVTDNVTRNADDNVTPSLSPFPNENNSNPNPHTHPDIKPARKGKSQAPAKPDDVSEQVWADFLTHRAKKGAPVSPTVVAGIRREAEKARWSMDAALTETVLRGWQGFKAGWVEGDAPQSNGARPGNNPLMRSILARKAPLHATGTV